MDMDIKLHMVRIRFGSFAFKKITKGVTANWIDKLSHIGGTAGLFNGFTFISAFEFLVFGMYMLIKHCNCFKQENKGSKILNVQEFHSNETENQRTCENMETELEAMNQMFEDLQKELIATRCKVKEDKMTLELIERELILQDYRMEAVKKELEKEIIHE